MESNRTPREDALRQRSVAYAAVHARHEAAQAAELARWAAELDTVTAEFADRVAVPRGWLRPGP
jgi:hypothetical protein